MLDVLLWGVVLSNISPVISTMHGMGAPELECGNEGVWGCDNEGVC